MLKLVACACCGSLCQYPQLNPTDGKLYGYTCITKVNPKLKRSKKDIWVKALDVKTIIKDTNSPLIYIQATLPDNTKVIEQTMRKDKEITKINVRNITLDGYVRIVANNNIVFNNVHMYVKGELCDHYGKPINFI